MLIAASGVNRKGAIQPQKLRGVNEADFFQKNNSDEKGFTFNYDGTLVDFRKPPQKNILHADYQGISGA